MNRSFLFTAAAVVLVADTAAAQQAGNSNSQSTMPGATTQAAQVAEVPTENGRPKVEGHPLTSVVVTQCNLIVAVYMTMSDGRLLRFDKSAHVPSEQLMNMAYSATRSERVEVSCHDSGAMGYETHEPV